LAHKPIDNVYRRMQIDAEWSVRGEWTFSWWANVFVQRVSVTQPVESYDCRVSDDFRSANWTSMGRRQTHRTTALLQRLL